VEVERVAAAGGPASPMRLVRARRLNDLDGHGRDIKEIAGLAGVRRSES
jgi:hypothetical protein